MGDLIAIPLDTFPEIKRQPFPDGYTLIPYSSIQPILVWMWHDVYTDPERTRVFLNYLLNYYYKGFKTWNHPKLPGILEELRDCQGIVEAELAESGKWLTLPTRGDVLIPKPIIAWCATKSCPRYAFATACVCCTQMRKRSEYKFTLNQSWLANRLGCNQATISRLVKDMLKDGVIEYVKQAGKVKNGAVYRWACCAIGNKKPGALRDNIITFQLPATGEKSVTSQAALR